MAYTPSPYVRKKILKVFEHPHYFDVEPDARFLEAIDEGKQKFTGQSHSEHRLFRPKDVARYVLVKEHFSDVLTGRIADIGSREFDKISTTLGVPVTGIDKNNPALASFDWDREPLPFSDTEFDTVLCLDTLEHISDFHRAFADLLRITKRDLIISLPNCWRRTPKDILKGYSTRESYGLPIERPYDRHHWYMNTEDIEDFMFYNAKKNKFSVIDIVYHAPLSLRRHSVFSLLKYISDRYYKNFVVSTVFVHLRRKAA